MGNNQPIAASAINAQMGWREWAMLLTLSVLWGGSFFFVEIAVRALAPLTVVTLRVGLAAVALWLFAFAAGLKPPRSAKVWVAFAGMGLCNNVVPFTLIAWAQTEIDSGLASILNATTPLFTVLVAGALLADERLSARKMLGVLIGLCGVIVIIGPGALAEIGAAVLAQIAVLGGALAYAFAGVFGRRFKAMGVDPVITAAGQVTASSLILAPIALAVGPLPATGVTPGVWLAVIGLALLSTAIAYILYFRILSTAGATNLLLVTFLIPVSAILLGIIVLGEALAMTHIAGMALIGLGLSAIDGRLWRQRLGGSRRRQAQRS